ncbi:MAG: TetR/AcrR family transcriptional regulator [Myxococcales bacterium]|nr:TetR/AcrR family transcriptional regulator [Myxococcales bacterium]
MAKKPAPARPAPRSSARQASARTTSHRAPDGGPTPVGGEHAAAPSETERRILAAALDLFAERGYAATTTAAIAKRAGVAEKTLFARFGTKDRLYGRILDPAALELALPEAIDGVRETFALPWGSAPALLDAFLHNRLAFVRKHPAKLKLIAQALLLHPERTELFVGAFRELLEPRVEQALTALERAGEIRPLPHRSLARIVLTVSVGYMLARFVLRPDADWDDEAEIATLIDVLVNGVRPRASPPGPP